jgi:hypothetical protein
MQHIAQKDLKIDLFEGKRDLFYIQKRDPFLIISPRALNSIAEKSSIYWLDLKLHLFK